MEEAVFLLLLDLEDEKRGKKSSQGLPSQAGSQNPAENRKKQQPDFKIFCQTQVENFISSFIY